VIKLEDDPYALHSIDETGFYKTKELTSRVELFKYLTVDLSMPSETFERYLGDAPTDFDDNDYVAYHDARVFFPDNIRESVKKNMLSLLDVFENLLDAKKLNFLIDDSDIRFSKLPGKTIGTYNKSSRNIIIQYSAKKTQEVIYTIIHEYGHKFWYEYMTDKHHTHIKNMFEKIKGVEKYSNIHQSTRDEYMAGIIPQLKVGQEVHYLGRKRTYKSNSPFTITAVSSEQLVLNALHGGTLTGTPAFILGGKWKIEGVDMSPPKTTDYINKSDWFPTSYSQKDHEEWFCEIFSFYVNNSLDGKPKEWMEGLLTLGAKNA